MLQLNERKWKKLLLWVSGYVNPLAFVLVGGYFMLKDEDEEVKYSTKWVFWVSLLFIAVGAFLSFCSHIGGALDWYGSWVYKLYAGLSVLNNVGRIAIFATCALIAVFKKDDACAKKESVEEKEQPKAEKQDQKEEKAEAKEEQKEEQKPASITAHASAKDEKVREFFNVVYDVIHKTKEEGEISAYLKTEKEMRRDLKQVCALVEERGTIAVSTIQKALKISYAYAGSVVEGLVLVGTVEKKEGSKGCTIDKQRMDYVKKFL